ncbi:urea amidolyase associated protein UAAP1 [Synoicihabitans lomoniglobus]|uniref:Urea carboxylase-associated family protein n=1 Tax=Synoicihabitans lomoniglobus TaxID=2909285 RepID=A0AAE9ZVH9_9BACT|nr:urea carboxylase-associated family protein [Opitutaceae bacterium LMO-M01]WED64906.1 urea carboxylase-associated family protein [Opitutaceae bacterium LMO-M01]
MFQSGPIFTRTLDHAGLWSGVISRGKTLRLTDLQGGANVGVLLYNADLTVERYNMPDTLKGQHTYQLTHPHCLHSDMGRLLASITADTAGWHDTACGCSDAAQVAAKYGKKSYQSGHNEFHRNGRECFLIELAKWGLGKRDLVPNLNLFSKVTADEAGVLTFVPGNSPAGAYVDLRLEMNTLVVLNTCQHPLDPDPVYHPRPVKLEVFPAQPVALTDTCINSRPENLRAAENTAAYHALRD